MRRAATKFAIAVFILVSAAAHPAMAQAPALSSPAHGQIFPAGPDYATDVLHDPWDFSNSEDISQHPDEYLGWAQSNAARDVQGPAVFLQNGRFVAQSSSTDPGLGLLYAGQYLTVPALRDGGRVSIETARYRRFAVKLSVAGSTNAINVHWFFGPRGLDGGSTATGPVPSAGDHVLTFDLAAGHISGSAYLTQPLARGLRFDPTSTNGAAVSIDWVRLTAPDGTAGVMMPVNATNCSGTYAVDVFDAAGTVTRVKAGSSSGTLNTSFNYGIFPPGAYTLRLTCGAQSSDAAFTINDPPRVTVLDPDERGGEDFATTVLGNAWDMEQPNDVPSVGNLAALEQHRNTDGSHGLRGVNVLSSNSSVTGDPQVYLLTGPGYGTPVGGPNNATPIATARYRYLTFTMQLHHPFDTQLVGGSMARIAWGSHSHFSADTSSGTKDLLIFPGRRTYSIDLASLSAANGGLETCPPGSPCTVTPWSARSVRFLRFDPHEFGFNQVWFDLDNVTLAAPDEVALGSAFPIRWSLVDQDVAGSAYVVELFYDTDQQLSNGAAHIATVNAAPGNGQYNWTPTGVPPGEYYVHLRVTEYRPGVQQVRLRTSSGVLRVFSQAAANPVVVIRAPQSGQTAFAGFNLQGCAYNAAAPSGTGVDEVIAYAIGGPTGNAVNILGSLPTGEWGTPLQTGLPCPGAPPQFANSGFAVNNIFGLTPGSWTFRVLARLTATGNLVETLSTNVLVDWRSPPARNLRLVSAAGNTVTIAWDPPDGGRLITAYRIEVATNPGFAPVAVMVPVPPNVLGGAGALPNGTWYVRVITESQYSNAGVSSNVIGFTLPGGGSPAPVAPPGAPTLRVVQAQVNPVTLSWSAGGGGAVARYVLYAGSAPGASNFGAFDVTGHTSVTAAVPPGVPFYVRLAASNTAGAAISNEVAFTVGGGAPAAPVMNPASVSGRNVTLSWNPASGATSYTVVARVPGSAAIVAALPGQVGTTLFVPNAPPGVFIVTVAAVNGSGHSPESNPVTVVVP